MKPWKLAFFMLLLLTIASNLWWVYGSADMGSKLMYSELELANRTHEACEAFAIAGELGDKYPQNEVFRIIRAATKDSGYFKDDGFHAGALSFYFDDAQKLQQVKSQTEPSPCTSNHP